MSEKQKCKKFQEYNDTLMHSGCCDSEDGFDGEGFEYTFIIYPIGSITFEGYVPDNKASVTTSIDYSHLDAMDFGYTRKELKDMFPKIKIKNTTISKAISIISDTLSEWESSPFSADANEAIYDFLDNISKLFEE